MSSNPYQSPSPTPLPNDQRFDIHQQLWAFVVLMTQAIVVCLFVCALWWCIHLYYWSQFYTAGAVSVLMGMFVFAMAGDNWVQRTAYACSVPLFVGGAAAGACVYWQLAIYCSLGSHVFSSRSGMAGLIVSLVVGGMLGGYLAYKLVHVVLSRLAR